MDDIIHRMVVAHTITPEAWLAITEADFNYDHTAWSFNNSRRIGDEWHIAFRSRLNGTRKMIDHVAFFELLDGTWIAQALGKDDKLHVMLANS